MECITFANRNQQVSVMESEALQQEQLYQNFVQAFRSYKKRKREWQDRMAVVLTQEEEEIRRKREALYADYE